MKRFTAFGPSANCWTKPRHANWLRWNPMKNRGASSSRVSIRTIKNRAEPAPPAMVEDFYEHTAKQQLDFPHTGGVDYHGIADSGILFSDGGADRGRHCRHGF